MRRNLWHHNRLNAHVATLSRQYCKRDSSNDKLKHAVYSHKSGNYHLQKITPMHSIFPMKYMKQKQQIAVKYTISVALIRPRVINTLTANQVGYETAYCSFLYMPIYFFHFCKIIIILLPWFCILVLMSFVVMELLKAASGSCSYKRKMLWSQGLHYGACGIRLHGLLKRSQLYLF